MKTTTYKKIVRGPRGAVLITAMWIAIALTAVVLVLCREMMVEAMSANQHESQAKVDAAEIGVEQYLLSVLENEITTPDYHNQVSWEKRQIGDCYFWVLGVNLLDETQPYFNLVDEASKIDLNTSTADMFDYLPGMDQDPSIAQSMVMWRDTSGLMDGYSSVTGGQGMDTTYYEALDPSYHIKNLPFESVEELRLVYGITDVMLWGADTNHDSVISESESNNADVSMSFQTTMRGLASCVTAWGVRATNLPATITPPTTTLDESGNEIQLVDINSTGSGTTGTSTLTTNSTDPGYQTLAQLMTTYGVTNNQIATATTNWITGQTSNSTTPTTPAAGGTATTVVKPFRSVAEWMAVMQQNAQATSADITPIYPYLVCIQPTPSTSSTSTATSTISNSTNSVTTNTMTIEGVTVLESISADTNGDMVATYAPAGKVNINTATKPVLMALPEFLEEDADAIISYRDEILAGQDTTQIANISWLLDCQIDVAKLVAAGPYITGASTVFSADIVTVAGDGRAFKRMKVVVDTSTGTPQIIYRKDLTDYGWPLDPQIRKDLRDSKRGN